jgi:hypothetical protein
MDPTLLTLSLLFSFAGTGLFIFGKKTQKVPHMIAGLALMTCPYFITNVIALTSVCVVLALAPFVMPET